MKYQKKNLLVLALAGIVTVLMAGECGGPETTETPTSEEFITDTVKATMWKNLDKSAFKEGTVTQVVVSGKHTYVATSDKGLFVEQADGSFKEVDLSKGTAPGANVAIPEAGKNIKHLTALSGDRVIFAVVDGAHSVIIAEGDAAKRNWAPGAASPSGDQVTSILVAKGGAAPETEHIFIANNQAGALIFMQLDSADANLIAPWNISLADSGGNPFVTTPGNRIKDLYLNHDGSALVFSKTNLNGYDTIVKANWANNGRAAVAHGAISIGSRAALAADVWTNANMPDQIVFTAADKAVFNIAAAVAGKKVAFATNLIAATAVNAAVALNPAVTVVNKLDKDGANVKVLAKEGLYTVDGAAGTGAVAPFFTGDNYMDEGKKAADLEAVKKKTDLKAADLGTKDIRDMAKSKTTTYYVTDKGLSVGKTADLKINKRKKT